jgi:hypothetical protein
MGTTKSKIAYRDRQPRGDTEMVRIGIVGIGFMGMIHP